MYISTDNFLVWLVCQSILLLASEVPGSTWETHAVCSWMHMCGVSSNILQPFCWDNGLFQKFSHTALGQCFLCMAKNIKLWQQMGKFHHKQQICCVKCMVTQSHSCSVVFQWCCWLQMGHDLQEDNGLSCSPRTACRGEKICEVWMHFTHQLYFTHPLYCHKSASITNKLSCHPESMIWWCHEVCHIWFPVHLEGHHQARLKMLGSHFTCWWWPHIPV